MRKTEKDTTVMSRRLAKKLITLIFMTFMLTVASFQGFLLVRSFFQPLHGNLYRAGIHLRRYPTRPSINYVANISKPYYHVVMDKGFLVDRNYFRLRDKRVSYVPDKFSISVNNICKMPMTSLFVVPSVATDQSAQERLEIRETWSAPFYTSKWEQRDSAARLVFFFGGAGLKQEQISVLQKESEKYNDIVIGDFHDTYRNLSLKMATCISWVARNCPDVDYIVKVDIDTYVNLNLLKSLVAKLPKHSHPNYVFGYQHVYTHPLVVRSGPWTVSKDQYPFRVFPKYIYGHSYVISGSAVKLMAKSFPFFPIVPNEDAFLTGVLAVTLNVTRFYHQSFAFSLEERTFCDMVNNYYASAILRRWNRKRLWNAIQNKTCPKDNL